MDKYLGQIITYLLNTGAKSAIKYTCEKYVIKATRKGKVDKRDNHIEILVTMGKPNYEEREFIKKCKKAGEPFPVKKIQLKQYKKNK